MLDTDPAYYTLTQSWNDKFWTRLGGRPDLEGLACLDLGCGVGALAIDAASLGARSVVGIDSDSKRIAIAQGVLADSPRALDHIVSFRAETVQSLGADDAAFDVVMARDVFEHIHDLPEVLDEVHRILRPGGRLYAGFGPLYRSPFGDHGLLRLRIPWAHLMYFRASRLAHGRVYRSPNAVLLTRELNMLTLADIERIMAASPLQIQSFHVNVSNNPVMRAFGVLRRIPVVGEYFSVNVYVVLTRGA
jgi:SAM-dependent methyltransferase